MRSAAGAAHIRGMRTYSTPIPYRPFDTVPETFTAEHEKARGQLMIEAAAAHPSLSARLRRPAGSLLVDPIRGTYPAYWTNPADATDRSAALASFRSQLPFLLPHTVESYLAMVAYIVHTEMKFQADRAYILDPDHAFELLIDPADYSSEEILCVDGTEENLHRLEALADTVAAHAAAANERIAAETRDAA